MDDSAPDTAPPASAPRPGRLQKQLSLLDVYAVATGATLSAGLFILPGLAAQQAGPAIVLCYLLAAVPLVPAMFSIIELSTAMPRAGGAYYFIDRSLGPMFGTVGGLGTWLALTLKTAFALVGIGIYAQLLTPELPPWSSTAIAVAFALVFAWLNVAGAKKSGGIQSLLAIGLLAILVLFVGAGLTEVDLANFEGFFDAGTQGILATTGAVYISYVGVTNVASVSEEVENPERNLPLGIMLSLGTAILVYGLATFVLVGVLPLDRLAGDARAPATAAVEILGQPGLIVLVVGAMLAFASVGNAGILSASRYPLAMSRDDLVPKRLSHIGRHGTPTVAIALTAGTLIAIVLLLDPLKIAKLASAFQLVIFAILCMAVVVWRESGIESYDPGYRSPFYPYMQIVGILAPLVLVAQMGWLPTVFAAVLVGTGLAWYFGYAKKRVVRRGALYHVFARLGQDRHEELDVEMREILKEKGLREQDPFDEVVLDAIVLDEEGVPDFDTLIDHASVRLAERLDRDVELFRRGFTDGTRTGATPVAKNVALPHMRLAQLTRAQLVLCRTRPPLRIEAGDVLGTKHTYDDVRAVFFLVSPEDDPALHLRMLAQLARRIDEDDFLTAWLTAANEVRLREVFLRDERNASLRIVPGEAAYAWAGLRLRDIRLPEGCLVAAIRRGGRTVVPRGDSLVQRGDRLLVFGEPRAIAELAQRLEELARGSA